MSLCVVISLQHFVGSLAHAALLIDDFSIDQSGISTDQFAAFDYLSSPQFLGGTRVIWGGGASISGACAECNFEAFVTGGQMLVTPGADCPGAGNVSWPSATGPGPYSIDLSQFQAIEAKISELTGSTTTRFTTFSGYSNGYQHGIVHTLDVTFNSVGRHVVHFSDFLPSPGNRAIVIDDVNTITMATYLDLGEFVAFDSIAVIIPEPTSCVLLLSGTFLLTTFGRRSSNLRLGNDSGLKSV
jgi:hypothetical protein